MQYSTAQRLINLCSAFSGLSLTLFSPPLVQRLTWRIINWLVFLEIAVGYNYLFMWRTRVEFPLIAITLGAISLISSLLLFFFLPVYNYGDYAHTSIAATTKNSAVRNKFLIGITASYALVISFSNLRLSAIQKPVCQAWKTPQAAGICFNWAQKWCSMCYVEHPEEVISLIQCNLILMKTHRKHVAYSWMHHVSGIDQPI